MLTLWNYISDCEEEAAQDELLEIVQGARLNGGPYGGQDMDVDFIIYEENDDFDPVLVAWRRNGEWEVIPDWQYINAHYSLRHGDA